MLAACGGGDPERVVLRGTSERGHSIELVVVDGRLTSLRTRVPVYCPAQRVWRSIRWTPEAGLFGRFEQDGPRLLVRQRADARRGASNRPEVTVVAMRGQLAEDGGSARGTIESRWQRDGLTCRATVDFSAERTP